MSRHSTSHPQERLFRLITILAVAMVVIKALVLSNMTSPIDTLAISDNDDIMRLMSIRDWLNGQSWYDMRQYRMVPPEGLDLHWSRYVDLGIAAFIWPLSLFLPMHMAESIALVVWPSLLFVTLILMTGHAARRMIGPIGGIIAILGVVLWPLIGQTFFMPSRIDHHNVQILVTTAMVLTLVLPGPPLRAGILGGLAAAFSMTVGLETLLTIALTGLILTAQTVLLREGAGRQLVGFSLTLALGGAVLFAGQTAPSEWAMARCDEISTPFLALAAMGALVCSLIVFSAPRLPGLALRVGVLVGLSAAGIAVLYPLIQPCLAGPYSTLPQEVQTLITTRIVEARPALGLVLSGDQVAFRFFFPAASAVLLASAMWLLGLLRGTQSADTTRRFGILLLFGWLGVIACLFQIRLVTMGAAAIPLLTSFALTSLITARAEDGARRSLINRLAFVVGLAATVLSPAIFGLVQSGTGAANATAPDEGAFYVDTETCRTAEILRSLNAVPQGVVLSSGNIGPPLLLLTHHQVLTGPYHRSAAAMADGALPFYGDEATMRAALARTNADYLLLCKNGQYGNTESFATVLAGGEMAKGLTPVTGIDPALLMFRVDRP